MHKYKRHYKKNYSFDLKEHREDGRIRIVGEDNSSYIKFLSLGGVVEDVEYLPPTEPEIEQKRSQVIGMITMNRDMAFDAGIEYNGNTFDSSQKNREMMLAGNRKSKKANVNSKIIIAKVIDSLGQVVTLDQDDMIALLEKFDDETFIINNDASVDYEITLIATEEILDYYIANNKYEV